MNLQSYWMSSNDTQGTIHNYHHLTIIAMQRIEIIGNLAKDAVRVDGQNGKEPFMSFTVICNEKKGENEYKASYEVTSALSGVLDFLKKGKSVFVVGFPSARGFLTKEQQPGAQIRINAHVIELL